MHVPSVVKSHMVLETMHRIEHHKFLTILLLLLAIVLVYDLTTSHELVAVSDADVESPLTRLDDPQFAHEQSTRIHAIRESLDCLRTRTGADRAYLVTYRNCPSPCVRNQTRVLARTFEIRSEGGLSRLPDVQDLSSLEWRGSKRDEMALWSGFSSTPPHRFGVELYGLFGMAVGHVGIEYRDHRAWLREEEITRLRQTAGLIRACLVRPLDEVERLDARLR